MLRSSNPALSDKVFEGIRPVEAMGAGNVMTIEGTVNKSMLALFLTVASAYWAYGNPVVMSWYIPAMIIGLIIAVGTAFKTSWAPYTTPIYALVEGVVLGSVSYLYSQFYDGIVFQAVALTFGVLLAMLAAYKSGIIKVSNTFITVITSAVAGIVIVYLVSFVSGLFGYPLTFLHDSSPLSIGISLVICAVAALSLAIDFHRIDTLGSSGRAPKYMEWYCAMALLITLIWLYFEILNLLRKINSRD